MSSADFIENAIVQSGGGGRYSTKSLSPTNILIWNWIPRGWNRGARGGGVQRTGLLAGNKLASDNGVEFIKITVMLLLLRATL